MGKMLDITLGCIIGAIILFAVAVPVVSGMTGPTLTTEVDDTEITISSTTISLGDFDGIQIKAVDDAATVTFGSYVATYDDTDAEWTVVKSTTTVATIAGATILFAQTGDYTIIGTELVKDNTAVTSVTVSATADVDDAYGVTASVSEPSALTVTMMWMVIVGIALGLVVFALKYVGKL